MYIPDALPKSYKVIIQRTPADDIWAAICDKMDVDRRFTSIEAWNAIKTSFPQYAQKTGLDYTRAVLSCVYYDNLQRPTEYEIPSIQRVSKHVWTL